MGTAVTAIVAALFGAAIGYYLRAREFRREHRLTIYAEYVSAFLGVAHEGSYLLSLGVQYADSLRAENYDKAKDAFERMNQASRVFENAETRLRLVGSQRTRLKSIELEDFIGRNIRSAPPFVLLGDLDMSSWGDAIKVGPGEVDNVAVRLSREFTEVARGDLMPRWPRSR